MSEVVPNPAIPNMPLITDSQMEAFEATIINAGFEVDDFNAVPLEDDEVPLKDDESTVIEPYGITGTVTVLRISTDEAITYSAWPRWVSMFEIDLHEGKFGQP